MIFQHIYKTAKDQQWILSNEKSNDKIGYVQVGFLIIFIQRMSMVSNIAGKYFYSERFILKYPLFLH